MLDLSSYIRKTVGDFQGLKARTSEEGCSNFMARTKHNSFSLYPRIANHWLLYWCVLMVARRNLCYKESNFLLSSCES